MFREKFEKIKEKISKIDSQYEDNSKRNNNFDIRNIRGKNLKDLPLIGYVLIFLMFASSLIFIILGFVFNF